QEVLKERSKALRKTIYQYAERIKDEIPTKPQEDNLEKELEYSQQLISIVEKHPELTDLPAISQKLNYLKEAVEDDIEHMEASVREEARIGHKSADTSFYGYKEHIAMTDERIITACVVTSGEKSDGRYLKDLYEKTLQNGVPVETIIGDATYSGKENLKLARKENVHLVSKLILVVCPRGHMAVRKARTGKKNQNSNQVITHYFDVEKCKICPSKEGCYTEGAQTKTYSVTIKSHEHLFQKRFQET
ncbi:TPA: transposase, partial [Streptococcus suis]